MHGRCLSLMVALKDGSEGLEGTKIIEIADEIDMFVERLCFASNIIDLHLMQDNATNRS